MRASPADFYIYSQEIAAAGDEETVRAHMELFAEVKLEQLEEESEEDRTRILAPFGEDFRAFVQDAAAQLDIAGTTRRSRDAARRNVGHARNEQLAGLPATVVLDGTPDAYARDWAQRERVNNYFRKIHGGAPLESR